MSENKIYNLKNDIIFKAFFSRKGNEEFLIDFLESLLNIKITKIAHGIPMGADIDYIDPLTLEIAMEDRTTIS